MPEGTNGQFNLPELSEEDVADLEPEEAAELFQSYKRQIETKIEQLERYKERIERYESHYQSINEIDDLDFKEVRVDIINNLSLESPDELQGELQEASKLARAEENDTEGVPTEREDSDT